MSQRPFSPGVLVLAFDLHGLYRVHSRPLLGAVEGRCPSMGAQCSLVEKQAFLTGLPWHLA